MLVVAREVMEVTHGVELKSEMENQSSTVEMLQVELAECGGGRVITITITVKFKMFMFVEKRGGGEAEGVVEEVGGGRGVEATPDIRERDGGGSHRGEEEGGGDDLGVHAEVGEEQSHREGGGQRGAAEGPIAVMFIGEGVEERERELESVEEND